MVGSILILFAMIGSMISIVLIVKYVQSLMVEPPSTDWLDKYHYAHRGLHGSGVPENSMRAFAQAVEAGYAIELDVRLTLDGHVVVFHDKKLHRMTGKHASLRWCTLLQLKKLKLADTEERIPLLEDVLRMVDGRVPVLIEIKDYTFVGPLEHKLCKIIKHYQGKIAVQSFSPFSLRWFLRHAPQIPRGQLACDMRFCDTVSAVWRPLMRFLLLALTRLETNHLCRPNFISYEHHDVNKRIIKKLRNRGAKVFAWTIRNETQMHAARGYIDAMIFEGIRPPGLPLAGKRQQTVMP